VPGVFGASPDVGASGAEQWLFVTRRSNTFGHQHDHLATEPRVRAEADRGLYALLATIATRLWPPERSAAEPRSGRLGVRRDAMGKQGLVKQGKSIRLDNQSHPP